MKMTERELFERDIFTIAEIITRVRKMEFGEYIKFKHEILESKSEDSRGYAEKVFKVVERLI